MKAVMETCVRSTVPGIKSDSRYVAGKTTATKSDAVFDSTEMKACFSKLQQLVPATSNREGKMDKTELLQHVIDYIMDLEDTLDFTSKGFCGVMETAISRQPLAEKSDCNIKASIKMAGGDFVDLSAAVATLEDFDFRPPSK
ncbi:DNA-binding protein inhibitor ID-2-like [Littorina saxatilis]|uniref:BHLH domain-containing protein n=1 Tax=Littorina saxatilis TaxID=31220 RepID=A0AAN9B9C9_9CAEN